MEPLPEGHDEAYQFSQGDLDMINQLFQDPVETACPAANDPSVHGRHITLTEQDHVDGTHNNGHAERNEFPVPQAEDMDTEAICSNKYQFDTPSTSSQTWPLPSINPLKVMGSQTQSQDPLIEGEPMLVPDELHLQHHIRENYAKNHELMNSIENESKFQDDNSAMQSRNAGNIPMHEHPVNDDTLPQQCIKAEPNTHIIKSEEDPMPDLPYFQNSQTSEMSDPSQRWANSHPNIQYASINESQAQGIPDPANPPTTEIPAAHKIKDDDPGKKLLEVEYQNLLKSIAALKRRKELLEEKLSDEAITEMAGIDQEVLALRTKQVKLKATFESLGFSLPVISDAQSAVFTGIRKGQVAHSVESYWEQRNHNTQKDLANKRKILNQETFSELKRNKKKAKTRPRVFDRMQDGSELVKKGLSHELGKVRFDNPMQARMTRDSIADGLESANNDGNDDDDAHQTLLKMMHPDVFSPDQGTLLKCAASFGERNCIKLADGNYRIAGCTEPVRPHQMCGASWQNEKEFSEDKGGIVANEQGTGKTYQAIINIVTHPPSAEAKDEGRTATLIIVPTNVLQQWHRELERFTEKSHIKGFMAYIPKDEEKVGTRTLENQDIIFVSHDQLRKAYFPDAKILREYEHPKCKPEKREQLRKKHLGFLFRNKWWRVIIDEAHAIKEETTKLFKACNELDSKHRWCLTGTPMPNYSSELWAYLVFLRVPWCGKYEDFKKLLDNLHLAKNKKKFKAWMETIMQRRAIGQQFAGRLVVEVPECYDEVIIIPPTKEEQIIYRCIENRLRVDINAAIKVKAKGKKAKVKLPPTEVKGNNENEGWVTSLNRLRSGTMHPFLFEPSFMNYLEKQDFDRILSALADIERHEPVVEHLKAHYDRLRQNGHVSDIGEMCELKSFGLSGYGGTIEIESYIKRARAARFGESCVICLGKLDNGQRPKCGHVCCRKCFSSESIKALKEGNPRPKCLACRSPVEDLQSMYDGANQAFQEESERLAKLEYEAHRDATMGANGNKDAAAKGPQGKDGRRLGDDFYGRQPKQHPNATWLAMADLQYPMSLVPSAKTTVIKQLVLNSIKNNPDDKIIIFNQSKEAHQIIGRMLQDEGICFVYFWGEMVQEKKSSVIKDFHENPALKVLVASLQCGGVGLNITCANRVIITEPWWNASSELQANARVYRMGQKKNTHFTTLIMKNTVDVRLRSLQVEKLKSSESALKHTNPPKEEIASLLGRVVEDEDGNQYVEDDYLE